MKTIEDSIHIDKTTKHVFPLLANPQLQMKFDSDMMLTCEKITEGAIGKGTRFRRRFKGMGVVEYEYSEYSPDRLIEHVAKMSFGLMLHLFEFTPDGNGTTLKQTIILKPNFLGKILWELVLKKKMTERILELNARLKDYVEIHLDFKKRKEMDSKEKIPLLQAEYFKLQDFYESFDSKVQTIKGWSVTISIAAITLGFSNKNEYIWLLAALSSLIFWVMEAKWKAFQGYHHGRIKELETAFKNNEYEILNPLQISAAFVFYSRTYPVKTFKIMRKNWVMIPYLYTIIICLVLFILQYFFIVSFW